MICRGIVESVIDRYKVSVRIPIIHRANNSAQFTAIPDLPSAAICSLPSSHPNLQQGDVVILGFENNDLGKPIILGHLYRESMTNTMIDLDVTSLSVINAATLPGNTSIGDIAASDIQKLAGIKDNIQQQLNLLFDQVAYIKKILNLEESKDSSDQ